MDIFSKNKLLLRLVFVLLVLNLFWMSYSWWQKKDSNDGRPPKRDIKEVTALLKEKLNLTDEQVTAFNKIREDFLRKEEALSALIKSQRDSMNALMFNENTDTLLVEQIARRVADNEYQMELYRLDQAQQLKTICIKDQLKKFEELVKDIRDYFQPVKKK